MQILYKGKEDLILNKIKLIVNKEIDITEEELKELRSNSFFRDRDDKYFIVKNKQLELDLKEEKKTKNKKTKE